MDLGASVDEHMLTRYRMLLDAEDAAFDELEHAFEEGDRCHFDLDLEAWVAAARARLAYLESVGISQRDPALA
jgi:hypothetical protein